MVNTAEIVLNAQLLMVNEPTESRPSGSGLVWCLEHLAHAFRRLDEILARLSTEVVEGGTTADRGDYLPGLSVSGDEVARLLAREPMWGGRHRAAEGHPGLTAGLPAGTRLAEVGRLFDLTTVELDVLLVALAVELDLKYERIFAYLQDDLTRRRPTVELVARVLGAVGRGLHEPLQALDPAAPLVARRVVELVADPNQVRPSLLSHYVKPDDQLFRFLVGQTGLDPRLASCCRVVEPDSGAPGASGPARRVAALARKAAAGGVVARVHLHGPHGTGKGSVAEAVGRELGRPVLHVDLTRAKAAPHALAALAPLVARDALFRSAVLALDGCDMFPEGDPGLGDLLGLAAAAPGPVLLCSHRPWGAYRGRVPGVVRVPVPVPGPDERRGHWAALLAERGIDLSADEVDELAGRIEFGPAQARDVVGAAWLSADRPGAADLAAAARDLAGHELEDLAERIEPRAAWDDLVVPADVRGQLEAVEARVRHRRRVLGEWGFGAKLSYGTGTLVLFAGPSGTGKTMAAEALAARLGLGLYRVETSALVSKYIGETEKNCERLFAAARHTPVVLFFDEADALFSRRTEVRDAHDRYANAETAYLLQRVERCDTPVILATNLIENIDDAFVRRVADVIRFPFPDAAHRERIWERVWPDRRRVDPGVSLAAAAARFELTGGNIKNVALAASFDAAARGEARVGAGHLARAIRDEFRKLGVRLDPADLERALAADRGPVEPRGQPAVRGPAPTDSAAGVRL